MTQSGQDTRVKLLLSYDIIQETQQAYYEFLMRQFLPRLQELGLAMTEAWHTAYGDYPLRLIGFVAPDMEMLRHVLSGAEWHALEERLKRFVGNYHRRTIAYRDGFQL